MEPIELTRASEFIHATNTLERLGKSPERIIGQAKLPRWHFCDPDDLVPAHHIHLLMDHAGCALDSRTFGLLVGAQNSFATLGSYGKLVVSSLFLEHALQMNSRLIHLHTSAGQYREQDAGDKVWFLRCWLRDPKAGHREMEQYTLMQLIELVGMAAGPSWRPAEVCLQTSEVPDPELREALGGAQIRLGQKATGIAVPRALLAQPLRWRDRTSNEERQSAERRLRHTAPATTFVDVMGQLVETLLNDGEIPRIETMAEIAGLSVRSLQRRLSRKGLSHSQIVDQARHHAAIRMLRDTDNRVTDIAMELGYADSAHFTRAFKRWTGIPPGEFRRHQQTHSSVPRAAA